MLSIDSNNLPWLEDMLYIYYKNSVKNTFPSYDFPTIIIAILHIIGFYFIYLGILLPPKYIWVHTIFLTILLISYKVFDNNCFMTLFANMDTEQVKTPIYVRMSTAYKFLIIVFIISIMSNIFPNFSIFRILKRIMLYLEPQ